MTVVSSATKITHGHSKVVRFFRKLTDAQVLQFVADLDKTLADSGMDAAALRESMMRFAEKQP